MFNKLKQFKDIRDKAKALQTMLASELSEGSAAWGKVKVTVDGNQRAKSVSIDPAMLSDGPKLESALMEAVNDAMEKMQKNMASKLKDMGGLDLAKDLQDIMK